MDRTNILSTFMKRAMALLLAIVVVFSLGAIAPVSQQSHSSSNVLSAVAGQTTAYADESSSSSSSSSVYKNDRAATKARNQTTVEEEADPELKGIAANKADGVYYGSAEGYQSLITVAVTVESGRITDVTVVSHADDRDYLVRAQKLIQSIINKQTTDVNTISGCTYSSRGIIDATYDALNGSGMSDAINSPIFSILFIIIALLLGVLAVIFGLRWNKARTRKDKSKATRMQQLSLQAMFFILAPSSFASAFMGIKSLFMQVQVMTTQHGYDFEIASFTILLVALLIFTIVFGRFFCGYACPFGFIGDVFYKISNAITNKIGIERKPLPAMVEKVLRMLKYVILIAICVLILLGFYMTINENSPWTAYSSLVALSVKRITPIGAILLALIVVGMLWKERFFCEFLCPLGAIFSLMPTLPTGRMRRNREACVKNCSNCAKTCPVDVEPEGKLLAGECLMCGRCGDTCPVNNIVAGLEARVPAPAKAHAQAAETSEPTANVEESAQGKEKKSIKDILISRQFSVIWKAVLLLIILWLLSVTRYLPTIF